MSSWIVHREHIDMVVRLAWDGPSGAHVAIKGVPVPAKDCWHRPRLIRNGQYVELMPENLTELGQMLWAANYRSVNERYDESTEPEDYEFLPRFDAYQPTVPEGLKLISCLDYQSSDASDWQGSDAQRFLDALFHNVACMMDGYDEAPWGWDADETRKRRSAA